MNEPLLMQGPATASALSPDPSYAELCTLCRRPAPASGCKTEVVRVVFASGRSRINRLIQWRTWSEGVNHVGVMDDEGRVIHADLGKGVQEDDLVNFTKVGNRIDVLQITLPHGSAEELWTLLREQVGKKYDLMGNIGFIFRSRMQNPKKWFCSEMVAWAFWKVGHPLLARLPSWKYSPEDLWRSPLLAYETSWILKEDSKGKRWLKWVSEQAPVETPETALELIFSKTRPTTADVPEKSKCREMQSLSGKDKGSVTYETTIGVEK